MSDWFPLLIHAARRPYDQTGDDIMDGYGHTSLGKLAAHDDMRLMTFMGWSTPQQNAIQDILTSSDKATRRYVSFQSCHLIDISSCDSTNDNRSKMLNAYQQLLRKREEISDTRNEMGLYIQRSIVLLGHGRVFWQDDGRYLYITLIKLRTQDREAVRKAITDKLYSLPSERRLDETNCQLYTALDYCDLVLFVKDIRAIADQQLVWTLIEEIPEVLNTITISCFEQGYLKDNLQAVHQGLATNCDDTQTITAISVETSVREIAQWHGVEEKLRAIVAPEIQCIFGRNDIHLRWNHIKLGQLFRIIFVLDDACKQGVLDRFEIVPLCQLIPSAPSKRANIPKDDTPWMINHIDRMIDTSQAVMQEFCNITGSIDSIVKELYRSLRSLVQSKYSDLFALSVLPSLHAYTNVASFYAKAWNDNKDLQADFHKRMEKLHTQYIQAIFMLIQCTMHGERQFMQVPSFHLAIFDVPPRLLTAYSGFAYLVAKVFNEDEGREFSFLIAPDLRSDIYVRPISESINKCSGYTKRDTHPFKLCIIYLNEGLFYQPEQLVCLLAHEIAHHTGDASRCRPMRADSFAQCLAMFVICHALPIQSDTLKIALAVALGDTLIEWYKINQAEGDGLFRSEDLYETLVFDHAIYALLVSPYWQEQLLQHIIRVLDPECFKHSEELVSLMKKIDKTLAQTHYLEGIYQADPLAATQLLANLVIAKLSETVQDWQSAFSNGQDDMQMLRRVYSSGQSVLQAYSEAFADLCMIELLKLPLDTYQQLMDTMRDPDLYVQQTLRKRAVISTLFPQQAVQTPHTYSPDDKRNSFLQFSEKKVTEYLCACRDKLNWNTGEESPIVEELRKGRYYMGNRFIERIDRLIALYNGELQQELTKHIYS